MTKKYYPFMVFIPGLQGSRKAGLVIKKDLKNTALGFALTLSVA